MFQFLSIDTGGNIIWQKTIGGNGDDFMSGVIQMPNKDLIGLRISNTHNNGDVYAGAGNYDCIIFKIGTGISICASSDSCFNSDILGNT